MTTEHLDDARRAAARRRRAEEEYREAIEEAVASGISYAEISRVLGLSRQAIRQYVQAGRKS